MKHGGTCEEREENHKKKMVSQILKAYEMQHKRLVPGSRPFLVKVSKATKLGFRVATNKTWLEIITVAREAKQQKKGTYSVRY